MGGMQVLEWAIMYPDRVRSIVPIATCMQATAQQIAWGRIGRRAIALDPRWRGGDYYDAEPGDGPARGPGGRPHGRPGDVPQRQRVHRPLRPRLADRADLGDTSACGSSSRSSATSTTTAPSSSAGSTPTATSSSARRWTSTTSPGAAAPRRRRWRASGAGAVDRHLVDLLYPNYQQRQIDEHRGSGIEAASNAEDDRPGAGTARAGRASRRRGRGRRTACTPPCRGGGRGDFAQGQTCLRRAKEAAPRQQECAILQERRAPSRRPTTLPRRSDVLCRRQQRRPSLAIQLGAMRYARVEEPGAHAHGAEHPEQVRHDDRSVPSVVNLR